jgi:hypothetical protein
MGTSFPPGRTGRKRWQPKPEANPAAALGTSRPNGPSPDLGRSSLAVDRLDVWSIRVGGALARLPATCSEAFAQPSRAADSSSISCHTRVAGGSYRSVSGEVRRSHLNHQRKNQEQQAPMRTNCDEVPNGTFFGGDEVPAGTFHGGDEVPAGTFHGGDEVPAGTFHS